MRVASFYVNFVKNWWKLWSWKFISVCLKCVFKYTVVISKSDETDLDIETFRIQNEIEWMENVSVMHHISQYIYR